MPELGKEPSFWPLRIEHTVYLQYLVIIGVEILTLSVSRQNYLYLNIILTETNFLFIGWNKWSYEKYMTWPRHIQSKPSWGFVPIYMPSFTL
jgi:hypothetical protein